MKQVLFLFSLCVIGCTSPVQKTPTFRDISIQQAVALLNNTPAVVVLDIRTPQEFKQGHIASASNIDFRRSDFKQTIKQLDKDKPYLIHCASGGRSTKALLLFSDLGFQRIYHLYEGFNGWQATGQPVDK